MVDPQVIVEDVYFGDRDNPDGVHALVSVSSARVADFQRGLIHRLSEGLEVTEIDISRTVRQRYAHDLWPIYDMLFNEESRYRMARNQRGEPSKTIDGRQMFIFDGPVRRSA